jgi:uncharacterized membrane protein YfcA
MTLLVVAILAVVQSIFGIGLLVFGTPTLLILGHTFSESLAILLPSSLTVSLLQVRVSERQDPAFIRRFAIWCLLPIAIVLAGTLLLERKIRLDAAVGTALAAFVALRLSPSLGARARRWVADHERGWLLLMGIVHAATNLGGGLLTILAASRHTEKTRIRGLVAFCYACFATIQLGVLALIEPTAFTRLAPLYAVTAGAIFLLVGQRVFRGLPMAAFDRLFTVFMAGYAGLLGLRAAGLL